MVSKVSHDTGGPCFRFLDFSKLTLRHRTKISRKVFGESIFARMHAGPVFALAERQYNILEELRVFSPHLPNAWGNSFRCEYMPRLHMHAQTQEKILANCLCVCFVP